MLQKTNTNINFASGVDTKTDPWQVPIGRFLSLVNTIFTKGGLLQKRNGYKSLPSLPVEAASVTTFNGDLTAVGITLQALSPGSGSWVSRGALQPCSLSVLPLIRNNLNQTQADAAIAPNGLVCTAYSELNGVVTTFKYVIADSATGQNIVAPVTLSTADATYGTPRVFVLGTYFVIVFTTKVVSTYHLSYIAVSIANPSVATSPASISTSYAPSAGVAFDGAVSDNVLYLAWNGASSSGIMAATLSAQLVVSAAVNPDNTNVATSMSVTADTQSALIWISYYDSGMSTGYTLALLPSLITFLGPTQIISTGTILNITASAQGGTNTILYEVSNAYGYDSAIPSNYVQSITCTSLGAVGSPVTVLRSVGLGSKSFILNGTIYWMGSYSSPYQPSYFMSDIDGNIFSRFAYENGRGYLPTGLPSVNVSGTVASVAYLFKDLIQAVNKNTNVPAGSQVNGIYSQLGINLVSFDLGAKALSVEIGNNLNLTGGITWAYDGYSITEQNFFLYPDSVEATWTATSTVTPTGTWSSGSTTITVSSATGIYAGMTITDTSNATYIPTGTQVVSISGTTVTLSKATTHSASGDNLSIQGNIAAKPDGSTNTHAYFYQVTYEWTDNQGNAFRSAPSIPVSVTTSGSGTAGTITIDVPKLRLTYKTANPVKIVIYRWSVAQQVYYQVTSLTAPVLNNSGADPDYISFIDTLPDATILGNNILYTTGGVVENIGPPSFSSVFLFDDRLWGIDSEDQNLLWFSKQIIESTPVEMSDLMTMYIAPSLGAQGPSGALLCGFPMDDKAVLFKASSLSYFNGTGPDNTAANSQYSAPILITSTLGCSNQRSIVFMPNGLMFEFAAESGNQIWLLGRDLSTKYIGAEVESFTQSATVESAVNIPGTNQVRFTLSSGVTLMYDYYYGQWGTFMGVPALSSTLYQGLHTYINSFGQVYQESPNVYLDGTNPVVMSFVTGWLNLAGLQGYIRAYWFYLLGKYLSPHKLLCQIAYDYNPSPSQSSLIEPTNFSSTYGGNQANGQNPVYGQETPYGGASNVENWRVFLDKQRCSAFQISVQEVYDASLGVAAGAGLTLSGINLVYAKKSGWRPISAAHDIGGQPQ